MTAPIQGWREEFDKLHYQGFCCGCYEGDINGNYNPAHAELKDFIARTIDNQLREVLEHVEIRKMKAVMHPIQLLENGSLNKMDNYNAGFDTGMKEAAAIIRSYLPKI